MDREFRAAMRGIRASGQTMAVMEELICDLKVNDQGRMFRIARFHYERSLKRYGHRDKRVAVKFLSDDAIRDRIEETWVKIRWRERCSGRVTNRRGLADLMIEEAVYRGIRTEEQDFWAAMGRGSHEYRAKRLKEKWIAGWLFSERCSDRGGHTWMSLNDEYICTGCRVRMAWEVVDKVILRHKDIWAIETEIEYLV